MHFLRLCKPKEAAFTALKHAFFSNFKKDLILEHHVWILIQLCCQNLVKWALFDREASLTVDFQTNKNEIRKVDFKSVIFYNIDYYTTGLHVKELGGAIIGWSLLPQGVTQKIRLKLVKPTIATKQKNFLIHGEKLICEFFKQAKINNIVNFFHH